MRNIQLTLRVLALAFAASLAAAPALADDDHGRGKHGDRQGEKHGKHGDRHDRHDDQRDDKRERHAEKDDRKAEKHGRRDDDRREARRGAYFNDRERESVRYYYTSSHGRACPPGLIKRQNGCMPPGHARNWQVGQPLPPSVTVYTVPQPILVTLPPPPPQHRYVRVSGDILLIAVGTKLVVDGINGLMN